jgi:hypothetical protein
LEEMLVIPTNFKLLINSASYQLERVPTSKQRLISLSVTSVNLPAPSLAAAAADHHFNLNRPNDDGQHVDMILVSRVALPGI